MCSKYSHKVMTNVFQNGKPNINELCEHVLIFYFLLLHIRYYQYGQ